MPTSRSWRRPGTSAWSGSARTDREATIEHVEQSPYLRALGGGAGTLHPRLHAYFRAVPPGRVGIGEGVFARVGTRRPVLRRLLGPLFRRLQGRAAVAAGWAEDVPFTVRNLTVAGRAAAEREFRLPGGPWIMRDVVQALPHGRIVDQLGRPATLAVVFDVSADDGALMLRSTRAGLRLGRFRVRAPRILSPSIRLTERFDDELDRQQVELTVDLPLIGRIYEYAGTFHYRIEDDA